MDKRIREEWIARVISGTAPVCLLDDAVKVWQRIPVCEGRESIRANNIVYLSLRRAADVRVDYHRQQEIGEYSCGLRVVISHHQIQHVAQTHRVNRSCQRERICEGGDSEQMK
jgi:hypothetical protein